MTDKNYPLTGLRISGEQKHLPLLVRRWRGKFVNAELLGQVPQFFMHESGIEAEFQRVSGKFLNITIASLMIYWGAIFYSFSVSVDVFRFSLLPNPIEIVLNKGLQLQNYKSNLDQRPLTISLCVWHGSCSLCSVSSVSITQFLILRWFDYPLPYPAPELGREESESLESVNFHPVSFHKVEIIFVSRLILMERIKTLDYELIHIQVSEHNISFWDKQNQHSRMNSLSSCLALIMQLSMHNEQGNRKTLAKWLNLQSGGLAFYVSYCLSLYFVRDLTMTRASSSQLCWTLTEFWWPRQWGRGRDRGGDRPTETDTNQIIVWHNREFWLVCTDLAWPSS